MNRRAPRGAAGTTRNGRSCNGVLQWVYWLDGDGRIVRGKVFRREERLRAWAASARFDKDSHR